MNRLIILGNGFDRAHGLKTSYSDFILNYLLQAIKFASRHNYYSDENISLIVNYNFFTERLLELKDPKEIINLSIAITESNLEHILSKGFDSNGTQFFRNNTFLIYYKNKLLNELVNLTEDNWYNIEDFYFKKLKVVAKYYLTSRDLSLVIDLNKDFENVKDLLKKYLLTLSQPNQIPTMGNLLLNRNASKISKLFKDLVYDKTLILNFNYTQTISNYIDFERNPENFELINIHGLLNEDNIIFGYGDEIGQDYTDIENLDENEFLKNVKSFGYLQNSNYSNLFGFLENDSFEIFIIGHSCALSDRTLLKQVFEHSKNSSIKVFYYKTDSGMDDFNLIVNNISRHFTNKHLMRIRVGSKEKSIIIPQLK